MIIIIEYLILEVWFDQKSSVFHFNSDSSQAILQNKLLIIVEYILRVKNRWSIKGLNFLHWILFKILFSEQFFNLFIENNVIDFQWISRIREMR
jgi:hypothetical protein